MRRNGWIVTGGVLGVLRGSFGAFSGVLQLPAVEQVESIVPGYSAIFVFELLLSFVILLIAVFAIVKANDPSSARLISASGFVIVGAGLVDAVWSVALFSGITGAASSAFGSAFALGVIGALLIIGARRLRAAGAAASSD